MATPLRLLSHLARSSSLISPTICPSHRTSSRTFATTFARLQSDIDNMSLNPDGSFKRAASSFRSRIEKDSQFAPERDRYHLYVSYACPWATRTLITRKLKGLEDIIPVTVVSPKMGELGWSFNNAELFPGADADPLYNANHMRDLYFRVDPNYNGRFTIPVLWDKKTETIVNNESAEIVRIFNTAFNELLPPEKAAIDLYPAQHRQEIDSINEWVYDSVNNGVYKAGFAASQEAYEKALNPLFESLDRLEKMLTGRDYLVGNTLTEADIRFFVTAVRFDPVYVGQFKCNLRTIRNGYPAIHRWMRELYWKNDAFKSTANFQHIKVHYYWSQHTINPTRIVPVGPVPHIEPL